MPAGFVLAFSKNKINEAIAEVSGHLSVTKTNIEFKRGERRSLQKALSLIEECERIAEDLSR